MHLEVDWIAGPWPGQSVIAPHPRGGDWLEDESRSWREMGLDVMSAAVLLIAAGENPEAVWEHIGPSRGRPVPDTDEQCAWAKSFDSIILHGIGNTV